MSTIKKQLFIWRLIIVPIVIGGVCGYFFPSGISLENNPSLRFPLIFGISFSLIIYIFFSDKSETDSKKIKDILSQIGSQDSTSSLLENFDEMQTNLNRVQQSIQKLLNDLKIQKILFEKEKERANLCKQFEDMNSDKLSAFKKTFQSVLDTENRKIKISTVKWNAIFCIMGVILGKIL